MPGTRAHWLAASAVAALIITGCGRSVPGEFTPEAAPSVAASVATEATRVTEAFLARMRDPDVTFRVNGHVELGPWDDTGKAAFDVQTTYDVNGPDYAGRTVLRGSALEQNVDLHVVALFGKLHTYDNGAFVAVEGDAPRSVRPANPFIGLDVADLTFMGTTDAGLFEFDIGPWLGGDPAAAWSDAGVVNLDVLQPATIESHRTRVIVDGDGVPHRLSSAWTFTWGDDATPGEGRLVDDYSAVGLYVRIADPGADFPLVATSHDVIVGVDAEHTTITQPWFERLPPIDERAELQVSFEEPDEPIMLGIEGAIAFLRVQAPAGGLDLDVVVPFEGGTVPIPTGTTTLVLYYRSCDGSCSLLDPPQDFCRVAVDAAADERYALTVKVVSHERAVCTLTPVS